jgi:hypothetical protein
MIAKVMNELAPDHSFWNTLVASMPFRKWLLERTRFAKLGLDLVTNEKWHQRWYRDPITKKDSETDILLIFSDANGGRRYALHIENKPDHRKWEPDQFENYQKRAADRMSAWRYTDYEVVLLAPMSFLTRYPLEAAQFDFRLSYEDVGTFIPEFLGEIAS